MARTIDAFGIVALLGAMLAAVLFGGVLYAAARGSPLLDIAAVAFILLIVAGLLYLFFFRYDRGKSADLVWMTLGASVGMVLYALSYMHGRPELGAGETAVSAALILLGAAGIGLLIRMWNGIRDT